jgi:hypothetical protein
MMRHFACLSLLLTMAIVAPEPARSGTIGGGDQGRCEMLESETTQVCTGRGKKRTCVTTDTYCGRAGNDGSCSCEADCASVGNC